MNLIRRRWAWLSYKLIGRRAIIALLLTVLTIIIVLLNRQSQPTSFLGSRNNGQKLSQRNGLEKAPMQQINPPTSATPIVQNALEIPKRIHHLFGDAVDIPAQLVQAVNSWANNHKNYNAYFWDSRYLETRLFPGQPFYEENKPCFQAERYTVSRLLLLLIQGGVIADPDLMSLRDVGSFLDGSDCIVSQEPPEVATLLYGIENRSVPSLRFAACTPGHLFNRLLLKHFCRQVVKLNASDRRESAETRQRVTASALTAAFEAAVSAYDDWCARRVCDYRNRIVLASAGVFLPISPKQGLLHSRLSAACRDIDAAGGGSKAEQLACRKLRDPLGEGGTRLSPASLAEPISLSDEESAAAPRIRLDRIGPNVGRPAVVNYILSEVGTATDTKRPALSSVSKSALNFK